MEDEFQQLLLKSIINSGVHLSPEISSIKDLTPSDLVSISAQSLNIIHQTASFPTSFPDSVSDQFKTCTELALSVRNLGYLSDISFHQNRAELLITDYLYALHRQFLYPSEEDSCKLIRFLVERLSESSKVGRGIGDINDSIERTEVNTDKFESYLEDYVENSDDNGVDVDNQKISPHSNETAESLNTKAIVDLGSVSSSSSGEFNTNELNIERSESNSGEEALDIGREDLAGSVSGQILTCSKIEKAQSEELELLKASADMVFDDNQHSVEFHREQLEEKIESKRNHLKELNSQWEDLKKPLEEEKRSLQDSLYGNNPETKENLQKLREIEQEIQTVLSEIEKRKDELSELSKELAKQPKVASRKSYIDRVKEITKNSRKQESDIEKILKDTRELQLESNSIQERLHRTYAIVDEIVFREAKKEPVGRQAYRLLTSIHESFEQISEKMLATDRIRREVLEHEKKLAAMASRSFNVDKLQSDLDDIRKENEYLEKCIQDKVNE
ncbi:hypothetical protein F8388_008230 [Cannabis sativa]|uniref:Coiled-coil domain-containing protein 22 n=1 Tax=Cannabis sativa TaxID=3483 RepID=A0A7J6EVL5_CANSA|nr:hypothetical protein F8388_008230 [Cannabis sativa]KAF4391355.1 hypothetical protein G4B88_016665 [Cannabis sativa]